MKKMILILMMSLSLVASLKKGDKEVEFKLPGLYNSSTVVDSQSLKGKVVLLNMWASWCSGCQHEMPLFVKLQKSYNKKDFEIVLVNIDTHKENGIDFLESVDPDKVLTALYDQTKYLPKTYRVPGMPTSLLIDKDGTIVDVYIGSFDEESIKKLQKEIELLTKSSK